jgi:hypothetical protein
MSNAENNEIPMRNIRPNNEVLTAARLFVIRTLALVRHLSLVLRHSNPLAG